MFPALMLGPAILRGEMHFEIIAQANLLFGVLLASFGSLIADLGIIASVGAQAARVKHLMETLDHLEAGRDAGGKQSGNGIELSEREGTANGVTESDDVCLELRDVALQPPHGAGLMLSKLSLVLRNGQSLLIRGESGIGKSSLLRAIGGLWTAGEGCISRCQASRCFFVPQEPYLCLGSLRDNATYPAIRDEKGCDGAIDKSMVVEVLQSVN